MKRIIFSIRMSVSVGMLAALLFPTVPVFASSQPTLKMEIVAPECTIDIVDDGTGPVQVITCPPGTLPPDETSEQPEPGDVPSQADENIIISQRLDSTTGGIALLDLIESLQDAGMAIEIPEGSLAPHSADTSPLEQKKEATEARQNAFVVTVVVATGTVMALIGGVYSHTITSAAVNAFQRIKFWRKP